MAKRWTQEEEQYLRENYVNGNKEEIVNHLGRGWKSIYEKAKKLKLTLNRIWSKEEIDLLCKNEMNLSLEEMSLFLNRGINSVRSKAHKLGVRFTEDRKWTQEEIDILNEYYENPTVSPREIAEEIGRTTKAVNSKASELGLWRMKVTEITEVGGVKGKICGRCNMWTPLTEYIKGEGVGGLHTLCKPCENTRSLEYRQRKEHEKKEAEWRAKLPETKVCKDCLKEFPYTEFGRSSSKKDGLNSYCKKCDSARGKRNRLKRIGEN